MAIHDDAGFWQYNAARWIDMKIAIDDFEGDAM